MSGFAYYNNIICNMINVFILILFTKKRSNHIKFIVFNIPTQKKKKKKKVGEKKIKEIHVSQFIFQ